MFNNFLSGAVHPARDIPVLLLQNLIGVQSA